MVFNSWEFIPFFAAILIIYYFANTWKKQKFILLVASYIFYAFFHPPYVLILAFSTLVDYRLSKYIAVSEGSKRKLLFGVSLLSNLGMLAYFKYADFALENFMVVLAFLGLEFQVAVWNIVLPVGISYYTFQTLSYTIDVYRRKIDPAKSLLDFSLFVAFFPQLVAGPIVRASEFLPQTQEPARAKFTSRSFGWGIHLLIFGLFGKIVLADRALAPVVEQVYSSVSSADFYTAWVATLAFSGQIFFDFAGYSTCAIGVAMCFGFALPDNFKTPYSAAGFSDFWRRWHISLSGWLRDYLYISLGGNRKGAARTYFNLFITMVIGGLWHGASWTFVVWGALHGFFLIMERLLQPMINVVGYVTGKAGLLMGTIFTYIMVCFTWVFFRAETLSDALVLVKLMIVPAGAVPKFGLDDSTVVFVVFITLLCHWRYRMDNLENIWARWSPQLRALILGTILFLIFSTRGEQREFIYFQF